MFIFTLYNIYLSKTDMNKFYEKLKKSHKVIIWISVFLFWLIFWWLVSFCSAYDLEYDVDFDFTVWQHTIYNSDWSLLWSNFTFVSAWNFGSRDRKWQQITFLPWAWNSFSINTVTINDIAFKYGLNQHLLKIWDTCYAWVVSWDFLYFTGINYSFSWATSPNYLLSSASDCEYFTSPSTYVQCFWISPGPWYSSDIRFLMDWWIWNNLFYISQNWYITNWYLFAWPVLLNATIWFDYSWWSCPEPEPSSINVFYNNDNSSSSIVCDWDNAIYIDWLSTITDTNTFTPYYNINYRDEDNQLLTESYSKSILYLSGWTFKKTYTWNNDWVLNNLWISKDSSFSWYLPTFDITGWITNVTDSWNIFNNFAENGFKVLLSNIPSYIQYVIMILLLFFIIWIVKKIRK